MSNIIPIKVDSITLYFEDEDIDVIESFEKDSRTNAINEILSSLYKEYVKGNIKLTDNIENINKSVNGLNNKVSTLEFLIDDRFKKLANSIELQSKLIEQRQVMLGNLAQTQSYEISNIENKSDESTGISLDDLVGNIIEPVTSPKPIETENDEFNLNDLGAGSVSTLLKNTKTKERRIPKIKKKR